MENGDSLWWTPEKGEEEEVRTFLGSEGLLAGLFEGAGSRAGECIVSLKTITETEVCVCVCVCAKQWVCHNETSHRCDKRKGSTHPRTSDLRGHVNWARATPRLGFRVDTAAISNLRIRNIRKSSSKTRLARVFQATFRKSRMAPAEKSKASAAIHAHVPRSDNKSLPVRCVLQCSSGASKEWSQS